MRTRKRSCPTPGARTLVKTSSRFRFYLASFSFLLSSLFLVAAAPATTRPPLAVEVLPDSAEIDPAALRAAVARELDSPVVAPADAASPAFTVVVSVDRARGELVVERRDAGSGMSRRVPLPADRAEALRIAVFLIGNLARDEASDVLHDLAPRYPPVQGSGGHACAGSVRR